MRVVRSEAEYSRLYTGEEGFRIGRGKNMGGLPILDDFSKIWKFFPQIGL
jgi:hypothetical protein